MPIELPVEFTFPNVAASSQKALQKLDQNVKGSSIGLKDIAKTATIVTGAFVAAGAAVKIFLDGITDVIDESNTLAAAVGTSAEVIQGLRQGARATGKELKDVVPLDFAKRLRQASEGSKTLEKAFKDAGVKIHDTEGNLKDFQTALGDTIDGLNENTAGTEKAALASELFGKKAKDLLTVFKDSTAFNAYIEQAKEFGIKVGPEATKASEDWQKANADLGLALDFVKRTFLEIVGGQETFTKGVENAAVNIIFLTETIKVFFAEFKKGLVIETARFGELARQIKEFATTGTRTVKPLNFDFEAPLTLVEILEAGAIKADRFRRSLESAAKGGGQGFRGIKDEVEALGESLDEVVGLFDFSDILEADIALAKILNEQWEAQATNVELINAKFDAQKALVEGLIERGADRADGQQALARIEFDRLAALEKEAGFLGSLIELDQQRKENAGERLAIAQAASQALEGAVTLTTELWMTNQGNNRELENALEVLRRSSREKTKGLEADLADLEAQLELATTAKEISTIEGGIADIKEQMVIVDEEADKRSAKLKKKEEERLQDTWNDIKAMQVASTTAAGATAVAVALAQLGPIAGPIAAAGIVATTIAQSLALIKSQAPTFHIGGNPFANQPLPGFSSGPDERTVTVTQNEIESPADRRQTQAQGATMFELPIVLSSQVIDTLVFEVATGSGRTGKLIRGGADVLRRPAFTGN